MSYVIYVPRKTFVSEALQESCYLKVHKRWTPTRLSFVFLRKNYLKSPKGRRWGGAKQFFSFRLIFIYKWRDFQQIQSGHFRGVHHSWTSGQKVAALSAQFSVQTAVQYIYSVDREGGTPGTWKWQRHTRAAYTEEPRSKWRRDSLEWLLSIIISYWSRTL